MLNKVRNSIFMTALLSASGLSLADSIVSNDEINTSLTKPVVFSLPLMDYMDEKSVEVATAPSIIDTAAVVQDNQKKDEVLESNWFNGVQWTSGFTGLALLTDPLTNAALCGVEATVYSFTGSQWLAKAARVGSYDPIYELVKDSVFITGYDMPAILLKAYRNPTDVVGNTGECVKTGLKIAASHVSSYLLTQPINEVLSSGVYYGTWCMTGNAMLSKAAYVGTKGTLHYTGFGKVTAKAIGYKSIDVLGYSAEVIGRKAIDFSNYSVKTISSYASSWWCGSKA